MLTPNSRNEFDEQTSGYNRSQLLSAAALLAFAFAAGVAATCNDKSHVIAEVPESTVDQPQAEVNRDVREIMKIMFLADEEESR